MMPRLFLVVMRERCERGAMQGYIPQKNEPEMDPEGHGSNLVTIVGREAVIILP
jgi:hypothetical protein